MTREQDREDLAHHEAEIAAHLSFDDALFDEAETQLLGCVYLDPPVQPGSDADVSWWVVDELAGGPVQAALDAAVPAWLRSSWPFRAPHLW